MTTSSESGGVGTELRALGRGLSELELVRTNFDNPRLEWRRIFAEVLGTFFLVLVGAGGGVVNAVSGGQISRGTAVTAPGLMVMAIILFMGAVSGAHLNPAVTLGFAIRGDFPWRRVPGYIIAELVGATLGVLFLSVAFGKVGSLGATEPGPGISDLQAMFVELILTVGLFSVILGTASQVAEPRPPVRAGGGRVHRPRGAVVEPDQRGVDEPRPLVRTGPGPRRLQPLLGVRRGASPRRGHRSGLRLCPAQPRGRRRSSRCTRAARRARRSRWGR